MVESVAGGAVGQQSTMISFRFLNNTIKELIFEYLQSKDKLEYIRHRVKTKESYKTDNV